jgi:hypothetical protein
VPASASKKPDTASSPSRILESVLPVSDSCRRHAGNVRALAAQDLSLSARANCLCCLRGDATRECPPGAPAHKAVWSTSSDYVAALSFENRLTVCVCVCVCVCSRAGCSRLQTSGKFKFTAECLLLAASHSLSRQLPGPGWPQRRRQPQVLVSSSTQATSTSSVLLYY